MRTVSYRKQIPIIVALVAMIALAGCGFFGRSRWFPNFFGDGFDSNGERIYFTATNDSGERIRYTGGPAFGGMMTESWLTCASCHGSDGQGGLHTMHMQVMDAPDIRWSTLSSGEHGGHGDEHEGEAEEETYDKDSFFQAVREGIEPSGHPLSDDMPRWELSDNDLEDLLNFLKHLP